MNKLNQILLLVSKSMIFIVFLLIAGSSLGQDDAIMKFDGKIKDEDGRPLSGATVTIMQNGKEVFSVTTDANGEFKPYEGYYGYLYKVVVTKANHTKNTIEVDSRNYDDDLLEAVVEVSIETEVYEKKEGVDYGTVEGQPVDKFFMDKNSGNITHNEDFYDSRKEQIENYFKKLEGNEKDKEKNFKALVKSGEAALSKKDYKKTVEDWTAALKIKDDEELAIKLTDAEIKYEDELAEKEKEEKMRRLIKEGDEMVALLKFENAKEKYEAAQYTQPSSKLPKEKLKALQETIDNQANAKVDKEFKELMAKAAIKTNSESFDEAKTLYNKAKELKPKDKEPAKKIKEIDDIIKNLAKNKAAYDNLITEAEGLLGSKEYEKAKVKFKEASDLLSKEEYPKEKITEIDGILAKIKEQDKVYTDLMAKADKELSSKEYETAIASYTSALKIKPTETKPTEQIEKAKTAIAQLKKLEEDYKNAITKADKDFNDENYETSILSYTEASKLKPEESKPKEQIEKAKSAIAAAKKLEEDYNKAIAAGDKSFGEKDYEKAITSYQEALKLKENETKPKDQIAASKEAIANIKKLEEDYSQALAEGDKSFESKTFEAAITSYQKASDLKPEEKLPKEKIEKVRQEIEAAKKREQEYIELMAQADKEFTAEDYKTSISSYEKALKLKPEENKPTQQIAAANKALEDIAKKEKEYTDFMAKANNDLGSENFEEAITAFEKASTVKPTEQAPKDGIEKARKAIELAKQAAEKAAAEAERKRIAEEAEAERKRIEEEERLAKEKEAKEKEAAKLLAEQEQAKKDAAEKEKLAREAQAKKDAAEKERLAKEASDKAAADKEAARLKAEQDAAEKERLAKEATANAEAQKLKAEQDAADAKRKADELAKLNEEKAAKEAADKLKRDKEEAARKAADADRLAKEQADKERKAKEAAANELAKQEAARKEAEAQALLDKERAAKEAADKAKQDEENARLARERAEKDAADKAKQLADQAEREKEKQRLAKEQADKAAAAKAEMDKKLAAQKAEDLKRKEAQKAQELADEKARRDRENARKAKEDKERLAIENAKKEEEAKRNQEQNKRYYALIKKADEQFEDKAYRSAKSSYNSALGIKPNESHPRNQIQSINTILENMSELERNTIASTDDYFDVDAEFYGTEVDMSGDDGTFLFTAIQDNSKLREYMDFREYIDSSVKSNRKSELRDIDFSQLSYDEYVRISDQIAETSGSNDYGRNGSIASINLFLNAYTEKNNNTGLNDQKSGLANYQAIEKLTEKYTDEYLAMQKKQNGLADGYEKFADRNTNLYNKNSLNHLKTNEEIFAELESFKDDISKEFNYKAAEYTQNNEDYVALADKITENNELIQDKEVLSARNETDYLEKTVEILKEKGEAASKKVGSQSEVYSEYGDKLTDLKQDLSKSEDVKIATTNQELTDVSDKIIEESRKSQQNTEQNNAQYNELNDKLADKNSELSKTDKQSQEKINEYVEKTNDLLVENGRAGQKKTGANSEDYQAYQDRLAELNKEKSTQNTASTLSTSQEIVDLNDKKADKASENSQKTDETAKNLNDYQDSQAEKKAEEKKKYDEKALENSNKYDELEDTKDIQKSEATKDKLAALFPEGVTQKVYQKKNEFGEITSITVRRVVVKGNKGDDYVHKKTKAGDFYFKNGKSISESTWDLETSGEIVNE